MSTVPEDRHDITGPLDHASQVGAIQRSSSEIPPGEDDRRPAVDAPSSMANATKHSPRTGWVYDNVFQLGNKPKGRSRMRDDIAALDSHIGPDTAGSSCADDEASLPAVDTALSRDRKAMPATPKSSLPAAHDVSPTRTAPSGLTRTSATPSPVSCGETAATSRPVPDTCTTFCSPVVQPQMHLAVSEPIWKARLLRMCLSLFALSVISFLWWFKTVSMHVGFCDAGTTTNSALEDLRARFRFVQPQLQADGISSDPIESSLGANNPVSTWREVLTVVVSTLIPNACTPCPSSASCTPSTVQCERGFVAAHHPVLSPFRRNSTPSTSMVFTRADGLTTQDMFVQLAYTTASTVLDGLPGVGPFALPPRCVIDAERAQRMEIVHRAVVDILTRERGSRVCASSQGIDGGEGSDNQAGRWGLDIDALQRRVERRIPVRDDLPCCWILLTSA